MVELGFVVVVICLACAWLGCWITAEKRRNPDEGMMLGLVFGPLGVLIEALLPTLPPV
jgi:hypothetical protein